MTEQELIDRAEAIQDACNLSGVVHAFSQDISELWKIARNKGEGTHWVNRHKMSQLYSIKIMDLTNTWM